MKSRIFALSAFGAALLLAQPANAAVTADEAAKLGTTLTPLGGERAGNPDGSIPAWDGGIRKPWPSPMLGDIPVEVFKDEKPQFQVTAQNMAQYEALLSDGTKALLQKYPESFRVDVYPTHRTAAAPQSVYDATLTTPPPARSRRGATRSKAASAASRSRSLTRVWS